MSEAWTEVMGIPRAPAGCAPQRSPSSMRRTSTLDFDWPDGPAGNMRIFGCARDAVTPKSGMEILNCAEDGLEVTLTPDRAIFAIRASPEREGLADLIGKRAGSGLRKHIDVVVPEERSRATPLYLLLDDMQEQVSSPPAGATGI